MPITISSPSGTATYYLPSGVKGDKGNTGDTGPAGPTGPEGPQGAKGDTGSQGPRGLAGETGAQGATGSQGAKGDTGLQGETGPAGPRGITGTTGAQGSAGLKGDTGAEGAIGPIGPRGSTGATGAQGPRGVQGATGPTGPQGIKGDRGVQGATGPQGETGPLGPSGATGLNWLNAWSDQVNYVENDAVFFEGASWFASGNPDYGEEPSDESERWYPLALQGAIGAQGIQGIQGIQGETGPEPWTLVGAYDNGADYGIGDAVTYLGGFYYRTGNPLNPGYPPTPGAANGSWSPVADRGEVGETGPQGAAGEQGIQGIQGEQGIQGIQGETGEFNPASAGSGLAYNSGTNVLSVDYSTVGTQLVTNGLATKSYVDSANAGLQTSLNGKASPSDVTTAINAAAIQVVSNKSADYTLQSSDSFALVVLTGATGRTFTLPNCLTTGQRIDFLQDGTGQITITASGITLASKGAKLKTAGQYSAASIVCVGSGQYRLIGDLG